MRKLLFAILLLALLALLPLLVLRSQTALLWLAEWAVDTFTDLHLVLRDPVLKPLQGDVSASEIHLYPKAEDGPPFVSVLNFSGEVDPHDIYVGNLAHTRVRAGEVIIYVSDRDQTDNPSPMSWLRYLGWVPAQLDIGSVHLITASERTFIFPLKVVTGRRLAADSYHLTAGAQYEGEPLDLELNLSPPSREAGATGIDLSVFAHAPGSGSDIRLEGKLRGTETDFEYDAKLDANYTQLGELMRGFEKEPTLQGALRIQAAMHGNSRSFTLTDASFALDNSPAYRIDASGDMHVDLAAGNALKMNVAGEISSMDPLLNWLGIDLRPLGKAQGVAAVSGTLDKPVVDNFELHSSSAAGLLVNLHGRLDLYSKEGQGNAIHVEVSGPGLGVLADWTGPLSVDPGPFRASGELTGTQEMFGLHNLVADIGRQDALALHIEGDVGRIGKVGEAGLAALEDTDLTAHLRAPDSSALAPYWGTGTPPAGFALDGTLKLSGPGEALSISGGRLAATSPDLKLTLQPSAGILRFKGGNPLSGLKGRLDVALRDSEVLSDYLGRPVPSLGAMRGSAQLLQQGQRYSLKDIAIDLDGKGPVLHARGSVGDVAALSGVALEANFSGIDAGDLLALALPDFHYGSPLGALRGEFSLDNRHRQWDLRNLKVASVKPDSPLGLYANGEILHLDGGPSVSLDATFEARDAKLLEALTGLRIQPGGGQLTVAAGQGTSRVRGKLNAGETFLTLDGTLVRDEQGLDQLTLNIDSPVVHLKDLGLQAQEVQQETYNPAEKLSALDVITEIENRLKEAPRIASDVHVDLESIVGEHTDVHGFHIYFTGLDNRYTLRRLSVDYARTSAQLAGMIDFNADPPYATVAGHAVALPMGSLTRDLGIDTDVTGLVNVVGGLTTQGRTGQALVDGLNGTVAIALEDAVIKGAAYDVLATDLLAWFYSGALLEKSTQIDCTMARFALDKGVAKSDSLYIETSKMVATGKATVDFGRDRLDVEFTPRSKSRLLQVPASVRIKGPFKDPKVSQSPIAAAMDASAELITLVPQLARNIFGSALKDAPEKPCNPG